jgi:hypothetical protein
VLYFITPPTSKITIPGINATLVAGFLKLILLSESRARPVAPRERDFGCYLHYPLLLIRNKNRQRRSVIYIKMQ